MLDRLGTNPHKPTCAIDGGQFLSARGQRTLHYLTDARTVIVTFAVRSGQERVHSQGKQHVHHDPGGKY